jgi:serine/threonine protein kinase
MIGQTISHYRITEKLGEGGMGVVYKALDTKLNRPVALKFILSESLQTEVIKIRLLQEARAAASVNHPNVCTVYEIDEIKTDKGEEQVFIAMEYIEGFNLEEKIQSGPLNLREAVDIAIQMAEGLKVIHDKGLVHRDIKSDNIRITDKGQVKIMDFGLVKPVNVRDKLEEH